MNDTLALPTAPARTKSKSNSLSGPPGMAPFSTAEALSAAEAELLAVRRRLTVARERMIETEKATRDARGHNADLDPLRAAVDSLIADERVALVAVEVAKGAHSAAAWEQHAPHHDALLRRIAEGIQSLRGALAEESDLRSSVRSTGARSRPDCPLSHLADSLSAALGSGTAAHRFLDAATKQGVV